MLIATGITISGATSGAFAEVIDVIPPNRSRKSVDVTHQLSTAMEFLPGKLVDGGTCRVKLAYDPTDVPPIDADPEVWTITYADSGDTTEAFTGFLTNMSPSGSLEDKMVCDVDIKVTGAITNTP